MTPAIAQEEDEPGGCWSLYLAQGDVMAWLGSDEQLIARGLLQSSELPPAEVHAARVTKTSHGTLMAQRWEDGSVYVEMPTTLAVERDLDFLRFMVSAISGDALDG